MLALLVSSASALRPQPLQRPLLVCSDVDGTLLTPSHTPTERTLRAVLQTMESSTGFCAATGRGRVGAYNALGEVGVALREREAPGVFLNGLLTYGPGDEILDEQTVPVDVALAVAAFAAQHGAALVGYQRDRILCDVRSEWTALFPTLYEPEPEPLGPWERLLRDEPVNKLIVLAQPERHTSELRPLLTEALGESAAITMAVPQMLEVLPRGGSKGAGVAILLDALHVPPEQMMAMGDAENDLSMLELAGFAVAMGQAPDSVRAAADHVTASNLPGEDGAAKALERFVLERADS